MTGRATGNRVFPELDLAKGDRVDSAEWGILEGEILEFALCALVVEPNEGPGRVYNWVPISGLTKATRQ